MLKIITVIVALGTLTCCTSLPPKEIFKVTPLPPIHLVVSADAQRDVDLLANGLHNEFAACGLGRVSRDTAYVTHWSLPHVTHSDAGSVSTGECPKETLIRFHNHPYADLPKFSVTPQDMCYLSPGDVRAALIRGHPFTSVGSGSGVFCYWNMHQVKAGRDIMTRELWIVMPLEGQTTHQLTKETINDRIQKLDNAFKQTSK